MPTCLMGLECEWKPTDRSGWVGSDHFCFCKPWEPGGDVGRVSVGGRDVPPTLEGETRVWKEGVPQGPIRREA